MRSSAFVYEKKYFSHSFICQKKWPEETAARVFLSHLLVEHIIGNNQFYFHVCFLAREKLEFFQGEDRKLSLVIQGN